MSHKHPIHIIGAGATGSRLFASLIELGFDEINVYDYDHVENHNLANQLFLMEDVGELKVDALSSWVKAKIGEDLPNCKFINTSLPDDQVYLDGTVFLLTDTMSSRKEIYEACIAGNPDIDRVIETRMASSFGNVYSFNPEQHGNHWLDTLIDDNLAEKSSCGSSISVGATANIIANAAVWQFMLSLNDPDAADDIVDVFLQPFCVSTRSWPKTAEKTMPL
ncbi:MAG: ThiF family adenylyltransferase [Candidatus Thorarchaeota archaeon]